MADPKREKNLPESRLGRLTKLAQVGLRSGAGLLLKRDRDDGGAKYAAEVLGQLRGIAAKVGQMAGYVDGVVPEEHRAAYEAALSKLQAAAPRSSPREIRRFVEEELKEPIDRLFAAWDDEPVASASIGQVHRAVLPEALGGGEVAVKVQHPGIVKALESDLANAGVVESMVGSLGGRKMNSAQLLDAVRARFREELDYALEADRMDWFRDLSAHDPHCHVPGVIRARSTKRVLATEFVRGAGFTQILEAPVRDRAAWASTMWRFIFRGNLVGGQFNADPHPGNYFFHDDGHVTFLDFGCVNPLGEKQHRLAHAIHHAALARDEDRFRAAARRGIPTRPGRLERPALDYMRACFEPLFAAPYRITRGYASSLVDGLKELAKVSVLTPGDELFHMPVEMIFMNRLQFGFYSVLARLDVEVDYAEIERRMWPEIVAVWGEDAHLKA